MERDLANQRKLEERGWRVLRFWESEIASAPDAVASEILSVLEGFSDWVAGVGSARGPSRGAPRHSMTAADGERHPGPTPRRRLRLL